MVATNDIFLKLAIALALSLALSHCGNLPPRNDLRHKNVNNNINNINNNATKPSTTAELLAVKNPNKIQRILKRQYEEWKGVRYRLGGNSKSGIDCSAFVRAAMKSGLGVELPRTTELQTTIGKHIKKSQLRPGDLVFFKTGLFSKRHVGIYMGNQVFLHASTSKGVMLSKLNSSYWINHYWHSRRVIGL